MASSAPALPICRRADTIAAMNSRTVIRLLEDDGWQVIRRVGSHHQMQHPTKPGTTTVPHPRKDVAIGTLRNIERQSGVRLRR